MTKISITLLSLLSLTSLAVAGDSKADKAAAAKAVEPPKKMEMPKAPAEIGERVKAMSGTWKCTGTGAGMDGKDLKFTGTMKSKADLDGFWAHDSFDGAMGEGKSVDEVQVRVVLDVRRHVEEVAHDVHGQLRWPDGRHRRCHEGRQDGHDVRRHGQPRQERSSRITST